MASMIELLNTIRENASAEYQNRIPEATQNNVEDIRYAMIDDDNVQVANEFMKTLLNKLIKSVLISKRFNNPLKSLKKGKKPLGDTIEEIYNNFLEGKSQDWDGTKLFERNLPDTKTVYHRMNLEMQYPVTVSRTQLAKAFMSYDALEKYITDTINTLYNSAELDEFLNMKQLFKSAYDNNAIKVIKVADPTSSKENGQDFIKTVKTISGMMKYPSPNYNSYLEAQDTDNKAIITFSRPSEQVLILPEAVNISVSVDVLANIFNMSVAEFNETRKILVDALPVEGAVGALVDENFFQIYDDYNVVTSFENAKALYTNYYYSIGQTFAYSILVNAVLFVAGKDEDSDSEVEDFSVTYTLKDGVTSSNKRTTTTEGASYTTTLRGVAEGDSVGVKMGGSAITTSVYDETTHRIAIPEVTGAIIITVANHE